MTKQELPALLRCPFCGGEAEITQPGTPRHSCIVECRNCGCRLESGDEGERSGSAWNARAALAAQGEPVGYVTAIAEGKVLMLPRRSLNTNGLVPLYSAPAAAQGEPITPAKLALASDRKASGIMYALNALGGSVTLNQPIDLALIGAALSNLWHRLQAAQGEPQEPAAWFCNVNAPNGGPARYEQLADKYAGSEGAIPLYASPLVQQENASVAQEFDPHLGKPSAMQGAAKLRTAGVKGRAHVLYTNADKDRPDVICDGNGQVVLDLCKVCGKAEAELLDSPECPGNAGGVGIDGGTVATSDADTPKEPT